ncbi:MAG: hypothetical protein KJ893_07320 [Candidatus Omnitrophica bacterium]|nr:hypothetical protein [Candidatus Omnitrophota bacterium]MBU4479667.1 hypothetical protein [Candidatus Omnitrophota bacterium]MCG2703653.1 hypothetical protein [Candidatus Omnitrophota bacterium]
MSKLKKLGKGLDDISHLFLSSPKADSFTEQDKHDDAKKDAPAKNICLIGDNADFRDSFLVINLSLALARLGMKIAVVDMDEGLPCVNFLLGREGMNADKNESNEWIKKGPLGIELIGLNRTRMQQVSSSQYPAELLSRLQKIEDNADLILLSISQKNFTQRYSFFNDVIREFLLLVPPEKNKMLAAYKIIKTIFSYSPRAKIGTIITDIDHMYEVEAVYHKMAAAAGKFLDKELYKYGFLFKIKQEVDSTANIASFYDADLTACISNIAQIIVLRLNIGEAQASSPSMFRKIIADVKITG